MTEELFKAQVTDTLTVIGAARELGVSRQTINRATLEGRLRFVVARGQKWIHAEWLEDYRLYRLKVWRTKRGRIERQEQPGQMKMHSAPRLGCPPILAEVSTTCNVITGVNRSVPVTVKSLPSTLRTSPPALANPRVQPRPKSSWLPKKERGRVEEGRV